MTTPLTPPDCDLRDFPRMMVDVARLMGSQFNATASRNPVAWMIGHKLWYRAWHQVPAASLPDDDEQLCHLAELGFDMKTWRKSKDLALRGWLHCDDGRLYHPMVAEVALEAWIEKLLQRLSSGAGNAKRYGHTFDPAALNASIELATGLLEALNPRSKALDKLKRRQSRTAPDQLPPGGEKAPTGSAPGVPSGSQETETGRETGILREEETDVSSLSPGKPGRARSLVSTGGKEPIPDEFPGPTDISHAESLIAAASVVLSAADHAKRFRAYAKTHNRRVADWFEAWVGWVEIEISKAPAAAVKVELPPAKPWAGPADVRKAFVTAKSEEWARAYIDPAGWQDVPERALIPATGTAARKILAEARAVLASEKLQLLEKAA